MPYWNNSPMQCKGLHMVHRLNTKTTLGDYSYYKNNDYSELRKMQSAFRNNCQTYPKARDRAGHWGGREDDPYIYKVGEDTRTLSANSVKFKKPYGETEGGILKNNLGRGHVPKILHLPTTSKFMGNYDTRSNHIYDLVHGQVDRCTKITEKITKYVREQYAYGSIIRLVIKDIHVHVVEHSYSSPQKNTRNLDEFLWQEEA